MGKGLELDKGQVLLLWWCAVVCGGGGGGERELHVAQWRGGRVTGGQYKTIKTILKER